MLFGTKVEWAISNPIIRAVSAPYAIFDTFEIMSSSIFYILEIQFIPEEGGSLGRWFMIEDFERVFQILNDPRTKRHHLQIFVPGRFNPTGRCSIDTVNSIYQGINEEHWGTFIFECSDRKISNIEGKVLPQIDTIQIYPLTRKKKPVVRERSKQGHIKQDK
jgi:hypothetical protein